MCKLAIAVIKRDVTEHILGRTCIFVYLVGFKEGRAHIFYPLTIIITYYPLSLMISNLIF